MFYSTYIGTPDGSKTTALPLKKDSVNAKQKEHFGSRLHNCMRDFDEHLMFCQCE